ncbi:MAG: hypothetical protein DRJ40_03005 [Thermoprotei archaeon]|nr:MAG: hypothetical protein DRJ40_03005 [Thermoprotei archaeon]
MLFRRAVYIGRFQPPHQGHLASVKLGLEIASTVIIGVRETPLGPKDPLTVNERIECWRRLLEWADVDLSRVVIRAVPDFGKDTPLPTEDKVIFSNHPLITWARTVEKLLNMNPSDTAFIGNKPPMVIAFNLLGYVVVPGHRNVHRCIEVSASELRRKILSGDESWKKMLPPPVTEYLEHIDIYRRLLSLGASISDVVTK